MRSLIKRVAIVTLLLAACRVIDAKIHVQVINRLKNGVRLNVHCRSKDDDIGFHVLEEGDSIEWSFHLNFGMTTLFYCDVQWGDSYWHHFDAYDAGRDSYRCDSKCRWMIGGDKLLYGFNQQSLFWEWFPLIKE
ncbi:Plant self-incompatibility protein S1 family [Striga hermonthica]|uniref:S-protein homolog n=1 Tax=Striga hermonthica TaxID=68872 RepID=A0A9N7MZX3_STRHE|nr:Plant self-incompatibility protein S1 family [Striga hermonthica]